MSITVEEKPDSRSGDDESTDLEYIIRGTADDLAAKAALEAAAPGSHGAFVRQDSHVEPVHIDTGDAAACIWEGVVHYAPAGSTSQPPPETGESSFNFDTGGGTQHITQSLFTRGAYSVAGNLPDFKGAIGVTHDSVEGVDISTPKYNFSETHYLADENVNRGVYFALTGKTNNAPFKGLAAGECLFLGASGSKRGGGDWEITFCFAASPNRTDITVGDMNNISKKGWEYMWVRYEDVEDPNAKIMVKKPAFVFIEVVYEEGDFAALGIGI